MSAHDPHVEKWAAVCANCPLWGCHEWATIPAAKRSLKFWCPRRWGIKLGREPEAVRAAVEQSRGFMWEFVRILEAA